MLKKLFGDKKDEFFVELDDSKPTQPAKSAEVKKPEPKPEPKPEVSETVAEKPTEEKPKAKKSKKTSIKKEAAKPAPAPVASGVNNGQAPKKPEPTEVEFATKYLIMPTGGRRRPGPSLSNFKNMARQVKVPRS